MVSSPRASRNLNRSIEMEKNFNWNFGKNSGGSDDWNTPPEAVHAIAKVLHPNSRVLCPFDKNDSNFVSILKQYRLDVVNTHIDYGQDFFSLSIKSHFDYIVSNPPYSKRDLVLEKLCDLDVPFAMLMNTNGLFDSRKRMELAINYGFQLLYLYPGVKYVDCNGKGNSVPFQSCYVCRDILAHDLMFHMDGEIYG